MSYMLEKLPRKLKKKKLGKKISRSSLNRLLKSVKIVEYKYPQPSDILPFEFCPKCGCTHDKYIDHEVGYPEVWIETYCARCGFKTGTADNSPFHHCLECPEDNYIV